MTDYYIEQNIPIPRKPSGRRPHKYPALYTMEVGESFFAPNKTNNSMTGTLACARPRKFTVRSVVEHRTEGVRIWRIK
jgi:hypothetical protein